MRNFRGFGLLFLVITCLSFGYDDGLNQERDIQILNGRLSEIESLAISVVCDDSSEWAFTSYGSKACGGPSGFIAYSLSIDVGQFLKQIEEFTNAQKEYNKKWEVISDCSIPQQPKSVACEDGKPVLKY